MQLFVAEVTRIRQFGALVDPTAKAAANACGGVMQAAFKANLRKLKHSQKVAQVYNLEGEPRPHLYETANSKIVKSRDKNGYLAVIGCRKVGAHISIISSGAPGREREARKWVVNPFAGHFDLSFLGSRDAGRGGVAGHFIGTELGIMSGSLPASKRTTGSGPIRPVREETLAQTRPQCEQIVADHFRRLAQNFRSS
jgi:hypothetical protein